VADRAAIEAEGGLPIDEWEKEEVWVGKKKEGNIEFSMSDFKVSAT